MDVHSLLNNDLYNFKYFLSDDVCRFCWNRNAERDISKNIENIQGEVLLMKQIRECLDIDLNNADGPKRLCEKCCTTIEKFHNFKSFCREIERRLEDIFNKQFRGESLLLDTSSRAIKVEKNDAYSDLEVSKNFSFPDDVQDSDDSNYKVQVQQVKKRLRKKNYKVKRCATYCNICHIDFKTKDKFSAHNVDLHGIEQDGGLYKCFGCEKRFKNRRTRLGHEINFCKGLTDGYKCVICERYLPKRRMYEAHMRDHRDNVFTKLPEDLFSCRKCAKTFTTKLLLKKHMTIHQSDKKNYVCETCGRVFTRQDYLRKHNLTHTGVKLHICPHCGFRSAQRSSLTVHIRKHTGERPYMCTECPQRCISSSNLRAHVRRHLGLKKYQCALCPKKFGYKLSLEEHIASTHERTQTHPCQHCGATYTRVRGLRRHLSAKHASEKDDNRAANTDVSFKAADDKKNYLKENEFLNQDGGYVV